MVGSATHLQKLQLAHARLYNEIRELVDGKQEAVRLLRQFPDWESHVAAVGVRGGAARATLPIDEALDVLHAAALAERFVLQGDVLQQRQAILRVTRHAHAPISTTHARKQQTLSLCAFSSNSILQSLASQSRLLNSAFSSLCRRRSSHFDRSSNGASYLMES